MIKKILVSLLAIGMSISALSAVPAFAATSTSTGILFGEGVAYSCDVATSPDGQFIYAAGAEDGENTGDNRVMKIDATTFEIVDSVQLSDGFDCFSIDIDPAGANIYLTGYAGYLAKISTSEMSIVSNLSIGADGSGLLSGVIDADGAYGYFSSDMGKVIKVNLANNMTVVSVLHLENASALYANAIDSTGDIGYFVQTSWNVQVAPRIFKVDLTSNMSVLDSSDLNVGDGYVINLLLTSDSTALYMSAKDSKLNINRIDLTNLSIDGFQTLPDVFTNLYSAALSADEGSVITFGSSSDASDPANFEMLQISASDLSLTSRTVLDDSFYSTYQMAINPVSGAVYANFDRQFNNFWEPFGSPGIEQVGVFAPLSKPSAPRSIKVKYATKKATFIWSAPASDGNSEITKYQYCFEKCTKTKSWKNTTELKVIKTGLSKGTKGTLKLRAVNAVGKSPIKSFNFKQSK